MAMRIFNADETIFTSNGLKSLQPIYCHEIRNESEWYLDVRVPLSFLDFIIQDNIIVAETLDKGEQAFRIKNISVGQDIKFEAWHIGYDSRVFSVELSTFVNLNPTQALTQLLTDTQTNNFTVFSSIATQLTFSIIDMTLYDALIDMAERYNAILEFDNWQIRLVSSIGSDKGVTVAYGKNLESSSFEENWDMVCTELTPKGNNGLVGTKLFSTIVYDRPYAKIVSFDTDDLTTLNNLASAYLSRFEKPRVNYKVKSDVILASLGDTIKVEAKQFSLFTEVLSYKFNVITRKMMELEFGNFRPTIRNAIGQLRAEISEQADRKAQLKIDEATGIIEAYAENQIVLAVGTSVKGQDSILPYDVNQWESGAYTGSGVAVSEPTYIRTKTTLNIPVLPSTDYVLSCSTTLDLANTVVYFYTSANAFISSFAISGGERRVTSPSNAAFIRARARKSDASNFSITEMPNHWVRVAPVGKFLKGSKFEINGEKIISQADGIEFRNSSGTPVVFFDTVNNRFVFKGQVEADTGLIGRFAISGNDLVYTSDLFDKDYDRSDLIKLHRIVLGFESQTPYDLAVYDFNNSGTLSVTDSVILDDFLTKGTALPTPRKRIRSVVTIGTNNGALITQAVAENGAVGPSTTIRGEKINTDLVNTKSLATNSLSLNGETVVGVIVESGSNANGRYVRFSDGTQICWFNDTGSINASTTTGTQTRWNSKAFTFPAAFNAVPMIASDAFRNGGNLGWTAIQERSATGCSVYILSDYTTQSLLSYMAIGTWR